MKENGGPAFPGKNSSIMYPVDLPREVIEKIKKIESFDNGMTLRDWFAGMAISFKNQDLAIKTTEDSFLPLEELIAKNAYIIADSMLKERSK